MLSLESLKPFEFSTLECPQDGSRDHIHALYRKQKTTKEDLLHIAKPKTFKCQLGKAKPKVSPFMKTQT